MKKKEIIAQKEPSVKESTNWNAWYFGLLLFLVIQLICYLLITYSYK